MSAVEEAIEKRNNFHCEFRILRADGEIRWLVNHGKAVYGGDGNHCALTGTVQDITDIKIREQQLHRTLDNLMEGCQIIGFDWSYLYINAVAANYGHRPREDFHRKKSFRVVS